ncbi:MAG: tetratricopeptide repeat protein, partial [Verrucomicrobiota bacterium]
AILQPQWSDPLYLLMAAGAFLSSSSHQVVPILHLGRFDLATRVAEHELGRIARFATVADGVHTAIMRQMAFLATLWGGIREDELRPSIENLLEIRGDHLPEGPGQTERKLVEALPSATSGNTEKENSALQMAPILPDIVGEAALVIEGKLLTDQQFREILKMAEGINFIQATASLIRTVQDFSPDGEESAIHWLDYLRQNSESNPDQLKWIAMQLPPATIALLRYRVDVLSSLLGVDSEIGETEEARIQNSLAVYFGELGKRDEALESARRAVEIRERLTESKPDAFLPDLAVSLNNLSNRLSDVGQRDEALEFARRAVEIYERLAESKPDAFLPDLASALNNRSVYLSDVGQRDEALESARRVVEIRERLAESKPDAFLPDLAVSLGALGSVYRGMEKEVEARDQFSRAIQILTPHFKAIPGAFAQLIQNLTRDYLQSCEALNEEPDAELLGPVVEVFKALQSEGDTQTG